MQTEILYFIDRINLFNYFCANSLCILTKNKLLYRTIDHIILPLFSLYFVYLMRNTENKTKNSWKFNKLLSRYVLRLKNLSTMRALMSFTALIGSPIYLALLNPLSVFLIVNMLDKLEIICFHGLSIRIP